MKRYDYDCPIEATLKVMGGKWKAICIYYLIDGSKRFGELMNLLETVSSRMLAKQLQELEADGIIHKELFVEVPPRVEYSLTEYGRSLVPLIEGMCSWGEDHLEKTGQTAVYN